MRKVPTGQHGFTRVDEEARPLAWVECLDKMHSEPFYRDYKARIRTILAPQPEGLYLEVGAGVGTDARALGAKVIAIDKLLTMCRESRARGQRVSVVANAEALPLPSELVDGCWSDRTFQHLADPQRALEEMTRVTKPGGIIVVVDPDSGTQTMQFPDHSLANQVLSFRANHLLRNGILAHEMGTRFVAVRMEIRLRSVSHVETRGWHALERPGNTSAQKCYRRIASYTPEKRRRDYWVFVRRAKLNTLGDITILLSKRRRNDGPWNVLSKN